MKKLLIGIGCVAVLAYAALTVWAAVPPWDDNAGHHIPGNCIIGGTLKVGGTQLTSTNAAGSQVLSNALKAATTQVDLTLAKDGSGNVTNVTVNTVYGFASSTAGVATNQLVGTTAVLTPAP